MKCELAQQDIALAVYGELPDEARHQLETHLADCADCRAEYEAVSALVRAMSLHPVQEPSANLLAHARLRLEEALDAIPSGGWLQRVIRSLSIGWNRLQASPGLVSAVLVVGLAAGSFGGYRAGQHTHAMADQEAAAAPPSSPIEVASVSGIDQQPGSGMVQVHYNRLVPATMQGSLTDPQIRQMLLLAAQSRLNPSVHDHSVDLLVNQCRAGHCDDDTMLDALMVVLRYDKKASVRLHALEGLEPYVAEDTRVRDAVLQAIISDPDAAVRQQAIGLVGPVEADSSVRQVLHTAAMQDESPYIRNVSRQVLEQGPQVQ